MQKDWSQIITTDEFSFRFSTVVEYVWSEESEKFLKRTAKYPAMNLLMDASRRKVLPLYGSLEWTAHSSSDIKAYPNRWITSNYQRLLYIREPSAPNGL